MIYGGGIRATFLSTSATNSVYKFLTILNIKLLQMIQPLISSLSEIGCEHMTNVVKNRTVEIRPPITIKRKKIPIVHEEHNVAQK